MTQLTITQLRGAVQALESVVDGLAAEMGVAHQELARRPYAILRRIPLVAAPAALVEAIQLGITAGVYDSIRAANHIAGACVVELCDWIEPR